MIPIICIGNYHIDKKIKEMMKICISYELKKPSDEQIMKISKMLMPTLDNQLMKNIVTYIQGDLRKVKSTYDIYNTQNNILKTQLIQKICLNKKIIMKILKK